MDGIGEEGERSPRCLSSHHPCLKCVCDRWGVCSRGALPLGQGTPGANGDKSNASAAFLGMVRGKELLHYLFYKYFRRKVANVSVSIILIVLSIWKASRIL